MTSLNNDELRSSIIETLNLSGIFTEAQSKKKSVHIDGSFITMLDSGIDSLVSLINDHDQQLLEAILEGIVDRPINIDVQSTLHQNVGYNKANEEIRQHIKSVFEGRK